MIRALKFRHRIWFLVVLAGIALVTVTLVTLVLGRASEREVAAVETRYVPLLELGRDLEALYAQIPRAFEDAAAAAEESKLEVARVAAGQLEARLRSGSRAIVENGGNAEALVAQLKTYYATGYAVTAGLVDGKSAEQLTTEIERMRHAQNEFADHLDRATTPDRRTLTAAFADARRTQSTALQIDIAVAAAALVLMGFVSWTLIRRMVRALDAVSVGMTRLAEGDFSHPIAVASRDELGELAREANRTADRLREARARTQALLEETQRQAEELARANRYKSEFLANMSHELRTPLNSIMLLSKILAENEGGELSERQIEFASLIHRSGDELLALINDILDLAKVESGKQTLVCETVKLEEVADYARRMFAPVADQKALGYRVTLAGDAPHEVRTDRVRLHQILKNLLSNAFKFTARGSVAVTITSAADDEYEIAVTDSGIGIAADQQALIFEAFAQAEGGGTTRKYGGTGLGLSIAKQLAERLGGSIAVVSKPGHGSTFRVRLPVTGPVDQKVLETESIRPIMGGIHVPGVDRNEGASLDSERRRELRVTSPRHHPTEELPPERDALLDGKTVLVIDDDMRNVYSLASVLRAKHMRVLTAADGQEGLDELAAHPETAAVLVDIMMPRMDGHETMRKIRADPAHAKLPIIALTAKTMAGEREAALASGADEYLPKPVDLADLLAWLRSRLASG